MLSSLKTTFLLKNCILAAAGNISNEKAVEKAETEFHQYQERIADYLTPVEKDYLEHLVQTQKLIEKNAQRKEK
jgi:hypothetical protein